MASFLDKLFKRKKEPPNAERAELMGTGSATFTPFSGNAYESDIYRSAIDAIARNAAKLKGKHLVYSKKTNERSQGDHNVNQILQVRPNPYMTAYDLIYKLVTHYFLHNNAFAFLQKDDKGNLQAIYPLSPQNMEFLTDPSGRMYCRFLFADGEQVTLHYSEVFIARRFFNSNDLLGDTNTAILPTLDLAHTQNEGLEQSIKSNATIRGILKYNQVLSPEKLKEEKKAFVDDYLNVKNNGGIAALDSKMDYVPLKMEPTAIDDKQLESVKKKIYEYLGISESIVNSTYTEDEWAAFYESVIEPLSLQFSLELTDKLFTEREQVFGNKIIFESNRLQFASNESKTKILKELVPMGLLTKNQALEILNLPPVEDGHKTLQSLNYIDEDIANQYQGGRTNEGNPDGRDPDGSTGAGQ
ncbi:phage portal protein [Salicibibacter kimchii]|uniref:Phage portal protein n=1 Tax=Salicibibacter kimchii TaxID=2099786 RepID=A0A345C2I4_9BACI|nr:phage portal protein [Salicibibacter kimchii]AXF57415.1 phage portal protein [Salicibibacter kimchii]